MRRFTFTLATSIAALVLLPAGALAGSHVRHHQRRHHAHHAIVRHERFGAITTGTSSGSGSNSGAGIPTASQAEGSVQSFSGGVLTLALTNGTMVSGKVTDRTEIECEAADMGRLHTDGDGGGRGRGDNSGPGSGGNQGRGGDNGGRGDDNGNRGDDNGDRGDDNGNDGNSACMAADLVAGASVRSAELQGSSAGAIWDKVELAG